MLSWQGDPQGDASLRIKIGNGLLPLNLLVILLIAAITLFSSDLLRIILGLPFVLFFSGYVLVLALLPKKEGTGGIERLALSFGLSIVVVPFIGLILNYTPWGITVESMLYSIASFIFVMSIITWVRGKKLGEQERFDIGFQLRVPGWDGGIWDKTLSVILVVSILGSLGMMGYVIATPKVGERFTEFYILGMDGKATDYPQEVVAGEEEKVIVGIVNREHETMSYWIVVRIEEAKVNEIIPVALEHDEKWEEIVSFSLSEPGEAQKVEFLLYKQGQTEIYQTLYLWVAVTQ